MQSVSLFNQFSTLYACERLCDHDRPIIKDGIIHPQTFEKQSKRILFIAKEHNLGADGDDPDFAADYGVWWQDYVYKRFAHRVGLRDFERLPGGISWHIQRDTVRSPPFYCAH